RETQLNVGYGRPGFVTGMVQDAGGAPIQDAKVTIDGQETKTDERGEFVFPEVASGETIAIAEKAGFAASQGKLVFVLRTGARLSVTIGDRVNVENEAQLFVLPDATGPQLDYPWFRLNP